MNIYLAVFLGGGFGSISRFLVSKYITDNFQYINPIGTFTANILATLILGIFVYFFGSKTPLPPTIKAMLVTGFCGGFSTFSTFSYETYELLRMHEYGWAIGNVLVSVSVALLALLIIAKLNS